jgi:hypothetical protein
MVRLWDLPTGQQWHVRQGHQSGVSAVCSVTVDGQPPRRRQLGPDGAGVGPAYRQLRGNRAYPPYASGRAKIADSLAMDTVAGIIVVRPGSTE